MIDRLYDCPIPLIAITGGIATGKSTVSELLRQYGEVVICADGLVKEIYQQDETVEFVQRLAFGAIKNGQIDFAFLRQLFFSDREVQLQLENYIYSRLPSAFNKHLLANPGISYLFYDVPLLFEKGLENRVDISICVYCPRAVQRLRLLKRDGNSESLVETILNSQMDIEQKKERATLVIDNSESLEQLKEKIPKMISTVRQNFLSFQ